MPEENNTLLARLPATRPLKKGALSSLPPLNVRSDAMAARGRFFWQAMYDVPATGLQVESAQQIGSAPGLGSQKSPALIQGKGWGGAGTIVQTPVLLCGQLLRVLQYIF